MLLTMGAYDRLKQFVQWLKPLLESYLVRYADELGNSPQKPVTNEQPPSDKVTTSGSVPTQPANPYSVPPADRYDRDYSEFNAQVQPPAVAPVQLMLPDGSRLPLQGMISSQQASGSSQTPIAFWPVNAYTAGEAGGANPANNAGGASGSQSSGNPSNALKPHYNQRGNSNPYGQSRSADFRNQGGYQRNDRPNYRNSGQGYYNQNRGYNNNSNRGYQNQRSGSRSGYSGGPNRQPFGRQDWRNNDRNAPRERAKRCPFHDDDSHNSLDCPLSKKEKLEILIRDNKCFNCGRRGHASSQCRSISCRNCRLYGKKSRHHTATCEHKPHPDLRKSGGTTFRPVNPDTEATEHNKRPKIVPEEDPEAQALRTIIAIYSRHDPEIRPSFSQTYWTTFDYEEDYVAERPEAEAEMSEEAYRAYCTEIEAYEPDQDPSDHEGSPGYD